MTRMKHLRAVMDLLMESCDATPRSLDMLHKKYGNANLLPTED